VRALMRVRLQVAVSPLSSLGADVHDEDAVGRSLLARLDRALARGGAPPAMFVVRTDAVWGIDLRPVLAARLDPHRFVASFAGDPAAVCVGVLGGMRRGGAGAVDGAPVPVAGVFIERRDGRWWGAWRDLTPEGRPMATDHDAILRARDGAARPGGLGGWFGRARFEGLRARLDPEPRPPAAPELDN
jgi:hypothetical protein